MSLPLPFPTKLSPHIRYAPGVVIPWWAAESKRELRDVKHAPAPEGWEFIDAPKVTLKPHRNDFPHYMNSRKHPIYVLYIRRVA